MLKIREFHDRLIFNMGIPISKNMVFLLRRGPDVIRKRHTIYLSMIFALGLCIYSFVSISQDHNFGSNMAPIMFDILLYLSLNYELIIQNWRQVTVWYAYFILVLISLRDFFVFWKLELSVVIDNKYVPVAVGHNMGKW